MYGSGEVLERRKRTWERRSDDAKKRHRPSLKNWSRDGFATSRKEDFLRLRNLDSGVNSSIVHLDAYSISADEFRGKYEASNIPCVISRIPQKEGWSAVQNWTLQRLKKSYGERMFKCGEDDDGYKIKMKLKYFLSYLRENKDDSPLYIFDSNFYEDSNSRSIMNDFKLPSYFPDDLFSLVGEKKRPPYRWFLIGPERSGSTVHIDPLGTSAWNTLISGRKRWVLFRPGVAKSIVKGKDVIKKGEDDEAINYFVDILPRIKSTHPDLEVIEFIQEEGETVFVPGGWWHGVMNLTDTVAVTQNFCSYLNFDSVWRETRWSRKKMAVRWLAGLRAKHPVLANRAEQINRDDCFLMYDERKKRGLLPEKKSKKKNKKAGDKSEDVGRKRAAETSSVSGGTDSEVKSEENGTRKKKARMS
eukprot:gene31830-38488_t